MSGLGDVQFWMRARCAPGAQSVTPVKVLWDDYKAWCEACGHDVTMRRNFVRDLGRFGVVVEFPSDCGGEPRPFLRQGKQMAGRIHLKHAPPAPVEPKQLGRPKGSGAGVKRGPTGPKKRARWMGKGSVDEAADVLGWLDDCCDRRVWAEATLAELWADYALWADGVDGGEAWHRRGFAIQLRAAGFKTRVASGAVRVMGLMLRRDRPTAPVEAETARGEP